MKLRELPLFRAVTDARHAVRNGIPLDHACADAAQRFSVAPHMIAGFVLIAQDRGNARGQTT
jgi:hypothetical protein